MKRSSNQTPNDQRSLVKERGTPEYQSDKENQDKQREENESSK